VTITRLKKTRLLNKLSSCFK